MPSFCSHYTLAELAARASPSDPFAPSNPNPAASEAAAADDTPVLRAVGDARGGGYDTICVPLTTERWKARWRELCLLDLGPHEDPATLGAIEQRAEAWRSKPAFFRDELTVSRLGAWARALSLCVTRAPLTVDGGR